MSNSPLKKKQWKDLKNHCAEIQENKILSFFETDSKRHVTLSQSIDDVFFDYSKQHLTENTIEKLCDLARACDLEAKRKAMFEGKKINITEGRAVLHTALRNPKPKDEVANTLTKIERISDQIRSNNYKGATGKPIQQVISLGAGGSDLGPRLICDALKTKNSFPISFVANIDGDDLNDALMNCDPETTLFIMISKSFSTQETFANFERAKKWLTSALPLKSDIMTHFVAISANVDAVEKFGFHDDAFLPMWDWVNGRFSVWSAVGLPIAIALGFKTLKELLNGAYKIDCHFVETPLEKNIPVLMALIGIWNINFLDRHTLALLPYAKRLSHFAPYIQQLDMESNGKSVDLNNDPVQEYATSPVIFGEAGTNGQHSFYQQLHQGTQIIPCDFIGFKDKDTGLLNNMLAQAQALMSGQNHKNPHQHFDGNRPSSTLLFDSLTPETLGMLIALYEHKIFVQGVIWNINSFDQYGVELGKKLAKTLDHGDLSGVDPSTRHLYEMINKPAKAR